MATRDISTRADIELFVNDFYDRVRKDNHIGIIFNEVVHMNWDEHIPLITDFWETILLDNPVYSKNAMEKHYHVNKIYPLQQSHFDRWLELFSNSLDQHFEGPVVELAKKRANSIASVMLFKMQSAQ